MKEGGCKVDKMWGYERMFNNTRIEKIEVFERHKNPHYYA
jgi:hypothetical protein